jgi:hypothetical protein
MPALKKMKPKIMLTNKFKKALETSPLFKRLAVSRMNVEKVVKAPQKPTIKKILLLGPKRNLVSVIDTKKPIIKHPATLTAKVP